MKRIHSSLVLAFLVSACGGDKFTQPMVLGGETVSAAVLNEGYEK